LASVGSKNPSSISGSENNQSQFSSGSHRMHFGEKKIIILQKSGQALEPAAQGMAVILLGGIQKICRGSTEGHGEWA